MIFNYPLGPDLTPCNTGESCSCRELLHHWQTSAPRCHGAASTSYIRGVQLRRWNIHKLIYSYNTVQVIIMQSDCCIIGHLLLFNYIFIDFRYLPLQWLWPTFRDPMISGSITSWWKYVLSFMSSHIHCRWWCVDIWYLTFNTLQLPVLNIAGQLAPLQPPRKTIVCCSYELKLYLLWAKHNLSPRYLPTPSHLIPTWCGGFMVNHDSCIPISDDALHFLTIAQQGNNPLANQCNKYTYRR